MPLNLKKIRKIRLEEEGCDPALTKLTPSERVEMVWEISRQAGSEGAESGEPRVRRDIVRIVRGRIP